MSISSRWLWILLSALALTPWADDVGAAPSQIPQVQPTREQKTLTLEQLQQRALQEGEAGKGEEAIRDYESALALQPAWKEGRWNLGSLQYSAGRFDDASKTFAEIVRFAPDLGVAWALLGLSEYEIRDYTNSLDHLQKAQALGVQDDVEIKRVSTYHLGLLLIRSGEFEQAASLLMTNFGHAPLSDQVKAALGQAALRIPLLPEEIDPSQDAFILAVGDAVSAGQDGLEHLAELIRLHPDIPYLHYACALELANAGQNDAAILSLREETKISPQSPLPWIALSRLQLSTPVKALQSANKAVAVAPSSREAHEALASSEKAAGQADRAAMELASSKAMPLWPTTESRILERYAGTYNADHHDSQKNMQLAMQAYASEQYTEASRDLSNWLKTHPEDGTAYAMLGLSEFALHDFDNARIHLDRGAQLGLNGSPESIAAARYTFGVLLIHAGEFERATEVLVSANGAGSLNEKTSYALGLALLRMPVFPAESAPDAKMISAAGAIAVLLQQSKYDEAFPQFTHLLVEYPATPFLHYAYGTALLALSEFDEAAAQMKEEISLSPKSQLPILRLASISLRQHRAQTAIEWAQRALTLAPNSVEAHYLLGRAALEKNDNTTALEQLEIASKLSPGSPEIHFNLAKAYERAHLRAKALQERAAFARLNAASEDQRSHQGAQLYSGPRDMDVITHPSSGASQSASQHKP